jgi:hypothetical protein
MLEEKPAKPPADELAKELKASLAQRRPRTWKPILALVVICSLILAIMAIALYPRQRTPALQIVALDGLFTTDETPVARAQLLPPLTDEAVPNWAGHRIVFDQPHANKPREEIVKSDDKGQAAVAWLMDDPPMAPFFVRYIDPERRQGSAKERGWVFTWPKNAKLLVVDVEETLTGDDGDEFDEKAQESLIAAALDEWRVVYLALKNTQGHEYRKMRGWLENQAKLPNGPILGRAHYPSDDTMAVERRAALKSIQNRFQGAIVVVVKSTQAEQTSKDLKLRTIRIGDAATPTWAEVTLK